MRYAVRMTRRAVAEIDVAVELGTRIEPPIMKR